MELTRVKHILLNILGVEMEGTGSVNNSLKWRIRLDSLIKSFALSVNDNSRKLIST